MKETIKIVFVASLVTTILSWATHQDILGIIVIGTLVTLIVNCCYKKLAIKF